VGKTLLKIICVALVITALLTPFVYSSLASLIVPFPWPFSRVFDRVLLLGLLIAVILFRRELKLGSLKSMLAQQKGLWLKPWLLGFGAALLGAFVILPFVVPALGLGWKFDRSIGGYFTQATKLLVAAALIGVLEEAIFRALLFKKLSLAWGFGRAALVTSALYAVLHFIAPDKSFQYSEFNLISGFEYIGAVAYGTHLMGHGAAVAGLFCVGMSLCWVFYRGGSFWICCGLHSGWVVAVKGLGVITTQLDPTMVLSTLSRRYLLVSHPLAWIMVIVVGLLIAEKWRRVAHAGVPKA
jgi:membrane protease YdiL (CAAX protease family)